MIINELLTQNLSTMSLQSLTIGLVIDTNDPQQMGRVRCFCPFFGDTDEKQIKNVPWAIHVSPLSGVTTFGRRGAEANNITGPVSYGMWGTPKIGAYCLVGCIEGSSDLRFWMGCIHPQYLTHTMPHGRFTWIDERNGIPDGPLDTIENPINPLYNKLTQHFTTRNEVERAPGTPSDPRRNMEWRTRGVDRQVAALDETYLEAVPEDDRPNSSVVDHRTGDFFIVEEEDGTEYTIDGQGYGISQQEPDINYRTTGDVNYDSHIYSWTTPGFHSISMDDRHTNCRMRMRTIGGHQIIMDDTNERIYLNTGGGKTWIELDSEGNIDIYAGRNISMRASGDMNFFTDQTFRVQASKGIHLRTNGEMRTHSDEDTHIRSEKNIRTHSAEETRMQAEKDFHVRTAGSLFEEAGKDTHIIAGSTMYITSKSNMNIKGGGETRVTAVDSMSMLSGDIMYLTGGDDIHLNGPPAEEAEQATQSQEALEKHAYWTARVPTHEPWARVFMKEKGEGGADNDGATVDIPNSHTPEMGYNDPRVNKETERSTEEKYQRNGLWHR
jgi:hypothetical protein